MKAMIGVAGFVAFALLLFTSVTCRAQKPELVVQTGHSDSVQSVAFSPDGKIVASGSVDKTVKLWDVSTGAELRTLSGHTDFVYAVAFSPDGKTVASGSRDKTIRLWDVTSGAELRTLNGHSDHVNSVAFSPDGKVLASASNDKTIKLWDLATGSELRPLKGHNNTVNAIAFSPDARFLASASGFLLTDGLGRPIAGVSEDNTVRLWDVATGTEVRVFKGHSAYVRTVAFSPDGKTLASGTWDNTVKLWDVATGVELRTISGSSSVVFSPDGKALASGGVNNTVTLWDVSTGAKLRTLQGHSASVNAVAFSPDGKTLASGSSDHTANLWDVSTGTGLHTLGGHSVSLFKVAFSPDGKTLASSQVGPIIKLWDVATGAELRSLKGHSSAVVTIAFSADGKTLASGSSDNTVKLWDIATGKEVRTLKHSSDIISVTFSRDGKTIATGGGDQTVKLWEVSTGTLLRTLKGHSNAVNSIAFSPDGTTLASGSTDMTIKLWDVATGAELRTLKELSYVVSVAFSPSGKLLASGSYDHTIKLWEVSTGTQLRVLNGHSDNVTSVAFSLDGQIVASSSWDNTVKLWNASTGAELRTLRGHSDSVAWLAFSPNNRFLVSGSFDSSIKVWEPGTGKEVASMIALDDHDWIVITPDGLFDGSPAAWNKIMWRFNNNTFNHDPVEAFFGDFYYPGLLADIFGGKRPRAPSDIARKDRRQPQLKLALAGAPPEIALTTRQVTLTLYVSEAPAGAQDVRLFRNGSLVKLWEGDVLKGQKYVELAATIPIVAGENRLTAYAFNHDNIKSSDATLIVKGADTLKRPGVSYILAVGVNRYSNPGFNLKYAVADADGFSAEVKRQQELLKNNIQVEIIPLSDAAATKANIMAKLAQLVERVQPEDRVVLYFAGHGMALDNRFYLLPHDMGYTGPRARLNEAGLQTIRAHSISDRELEHALEKLDAEQILLVIDSCNSGQALEAEEKRRGPMNSKGLAQLAYEKGMYILTAAQSYQAAQEAALLGHGFLTYALVVEGLENGAADDGPKNGVVLLREWLDYATIRVPQMQLEKMKQARGIGLHLSFVEGEPKDLPPEQRGVQRPRVFYRRELEAQPLVVAQTETAKP